MSARCMGLAIAAAHLYAPCSGVSTSTFDVFSREAQEVCTCVIAAAATPACSFFSCSALALDQYDLACKASVVFIHTSKSGWCAGLAKDPGAIAAFLTNAASSAQPA